LVPGAALSVDTVRRRAGSRESQRSRSRARRAAAPRDGPACRAVRPEQHAVEVGRIGVLPGGGRAALLQLAHPYVAHGVDQHSKTRTDPFGRFQRTSPSVRHDLRRSRFGNRVGAPRAPHHERITGPIREPVGRFAEARRIGANEVPRCVGPRHAVGLGGQAFELVVRPLSSAEKDRYYEETKLFALLFGSRAARCAGLASFAAYNGDVESEEVVGDTAREIASFLFTPPIDCSDRSRRSRSPHRRLLPPRFARLGLKFGVASACLRRHDPRFGRPTVAGRPDPLSAGLSRCAPPARWPDRPRPIGELLNGSTRRSGSRRSTVRGRVRSLGRTTHQQCLDLIDRTTRRRTPSADW